MPAHPPLTRRAIVAGLASIGAAGFARPSQADDVVRIVGDDGQTIPTIRLPNELSPSSLPGIVWVGASRPDVTFIEFFDYNCPFCRRSVPDLDAMLAIDKGLRLGLVNNAIISIGSIQAAKVEQAVLRLRGPAMAYRFHKALFARRGAIDGTIALQVAETLGVLQRDVEAAADGDAVTSVLKQQAKTAQALGLAVTPAFAVNGVGILGYPGRKALVRIATSVRSCEKLSC